MRPLLILLTLILPLLGDQLTQKRTIIPILTDGEPHLLIELTLTLDEPATLTSAEISLGQNTNPKDLLNLQLRLNKEQAFPLHPNPATTTNLHGQIDLPAGRHQLELHGSVRKGSNLLHKINPTCLSLSFSNDSTLKPRETSLTPLRLAYRIHKRGDHQCNTFRIPGLARANDGSLLAVYDMRYNSSRDLQEHIDIGLSRSTDNGQTWSAPVPIMDMGPYGGKPEKENGCSDPNILVDKNTGEIFVFALWSHGRPNTHQWHGKGSSPGHSLDVSSQFMVVRSIDHGQTWSKPINLTTSVKDPAWYLFAPAPGNGITLHDGTLVIPSQGRDANGTPFSNITWSKDHGKTWTVSKPARDNTTESAVVQLSNQSLLLNMRDNRNRKDKSETNGRALSTTTDLGETWSLHPADHSALPEPVCMASTIAHQLPDGRHILIHSNPRHKASRRNITIQISFDDGKTWPPGKRLRLDAGTGFGYSSLTIIDPLTLGILYESSQADMTFQKIPLADVLKEPLNP